MTQEQELAKWLCKKIDNTEPRFSYVDDTDLESVILDGHFNMVEVATAILKRFKK